jgi:tetratricopeptide (TPR) repeat protein
MVENKEVAASPKSYKSKSYKWKIDEDLVSIVQYHLSLSPPHEVKQDPYEYWLRRAEEYFHKEKYDEAIRCYDKFLKIDPNEYKRETIVRHGKALIFEKWGKYDEALKCYDDYLKKYPNDLLIYDASIWYYKASLLSRLQRYDEAILCYDKYSKHEPDNLWALLEMASAFGELGKYSEVIKWSDKVIAKQKSTYIVIDRRDPVIGAWFLKGNALDALGQYDEAIKCYDKVIKELPGTALYYRARSKVKKGDIENGLSDLKAAIRSNIHYVELAKTDKDFESIRNNKAFRKRLENIIHEEKRRKEGSAE